MAELFIGLFVYFKCMHIYMYVYIYIYIYSGV